MNASKLLLALITLITVGCAQTTSDVLTSSVGSPLASTQEAAPEEVDPTLCDVVFTPEPELLALTIEATARWARATGCNISVGEGGYRVRLVAKLIDRSNGRKLLGDTHWIENNELVVDVTPEGRAKHGDDIVSHEIGHVLTLLNGNLITPEASHADDGISLMSPMGGNLRITTNDLAIVCGGLHCQAFTPEN